MPLTQTERAAIEKASKRIEDAMLMCGRSPQVATLSEGARAQMAFKSALDAATAPEPSAPGEWRKEVEEAVRDYAGAHGEHGAARYADDLRRDKACERASASWSNLTDLLDSVDALAKRETRALVGEDGRLVNEAVRICHAAIKANFVGQEAILLAMSNADLYNVARFSPSDDAAFLALCVAEAVAGAGEIPWRFMVRVAIALDRYQRGEEPEGGR